MHLSGQYILLLVYLTDYSMEYSAASVPLYGVSDERSSLRQLGATAVQKVALELITHGADAKTLCRSEAHTSPLHVALITGLCAGKCLIGVRDYICTRNIN